MSKRSKNTELDKKFDKYWKESYGSVLDNEKSNTIYNSIVKELNFQEDKNNLKIKYHKLLKYAAIFVISVSIVSYFTLIKNENSIIHNDNGINELKVVVSPQLIKLQDSSEIELYPNSKLTYPTAFNDDIREVFLVGSALFHIAKNEKKPFLVHQGNLITKVLGTSFLIDEDSIANLTKIYLHTGKISISNMDKTINKVLFPGDSFVYDKVTNKEVINKIDLIKNEIITFNKVMNNKISIEFVNVKLKDAYKKIQEQTGIQIDYSNIGIGGELILSLEYKDKSIDKIIRELNSFSEYSYEIKNNVLIIIE